jgi:hypothetical protein
VESRPGVRQRRIEVRERRGRLDGHRLHRDLREEQPEEGRLDGHAEGDLTVRRSGPIVDARAAAFAAFIMVAADDGGVTSPMLLYFAHKRG